MDQEQQRFPRSAPLSTVEGSRPSPARVPSTPEHQAAARVDLRRARTQVDQIRYRLIEDAVQQGRADYWRRRADTFDWARPRPTDFNGRATAAELAARDARLARLAKLCRFHARLIETTRDAEIAAELAELLAVEGVA